MWIAESNAIENYSQLFNRACLECPNLPPVCHNCPKGQVCTLTEQTCYKCAEAKCIQPPDESPTDSHTKIIAGSIVGGLVGIGLIVGFALWYKFRHRRVKRLENEEAGRVYGPEDVASPMPDMFRTETLSTIRSTKSVSDGSNFIPFIPGIFSIHDESSSFRPDDHSVPAPETASMKNREVNGIALREMLQMRLARLAQGGLKRDTSDARSNAGLSILTVAERDRTEPEK